MAATNGPQGLLLPVLGILLVTSEWSQRTALVSFTLTPVRGRVLLAKVLGGLLAGLAAIALTVVVAALATIVAGADNAWAQVGVDDLGKFVLLQATGILQGLAFGLLFLNSSAAIVSYFVLPTALNILGSFWTAMAEVQPWFDLWSSQSPLFLGGNLTSEQWAQCATSTLHLGRAAVRGRSGASPPSGGEVTMTDKTRSNVTSEVFILLPVEP